MNGLNTPAPPTPARQLREQLALVEACEPIEQELMAAKQAYREALEGGDEQVIAAAKARKHAAAHHINETRTWLRGESQLAKLAAGITEAETQLAGPHWQAQPNWRAEDHKHLEELKAHLEEMKAQVPGMEKLVAPYREFLGTLPPPELQVTADDGSASVATSAVRVTARGN